MVKPTHRRLQRSIILPASIRPPHTLRFNPVRALMVLANMIQDTAYTYVAGQSQTNMPMMGVPASQTGPSQSGGMPTNTNYPGSNWSSYPNMAASGQGPYGSTAANVPNNNGAGYYYYGGPYYPTN